MTQQVHHIWDPFVRLFHWTVVVIFAVNHFFTDGSGKIHEYLGYTVLALVIARIIWGFIGPFNAQFKSFFPTPSRVSQHLIRLKNRQFDPDEGHNPLAGIMILLLLFGLLLTATTGWLLEWEMFWGEDWLEDIHTISSDVVCILAAIHIVAVLVMSKITGHKLVTTMITGNRIVEND